VVTTILPSLLAVLIRGKCPLLDAISYWIAQFLGALVAVAIVIYLKGSPQLPPPGDFRIGLALLAEFLGTFALCFVVLNVATAKGTEGNSFFEALRKQAEKEQKAAEKLGPVKLGTFKE
jgi:glycerol uptake facilitator-like aquaporin